MKRFFTLMVLEVIMAISTVAGASELAPFVTSIDLYASVDGQSESIGQFEKDGDGVWRLNNVSINDGTTFKLKLHINNPEEQERDEWFGSKDDAAQTLKKESLGAVVECSNSSDASDFRIGHAGTFSFALSDNDINNVQFQLEGEFEDARYLTGEFNDWGEIRFTAWVGEYTLDFYPDDGVLMSGQFLIVDQDYNVLGGATDDDYYTITGDNPNVTLVTEAQGQRNLYLADEGYYSFVISDDDVLTIKNWPEEVISACIVGSNAQGWDMTNATFIPLTFDEATGCYVSNPTGIPAGFKCQVIKNSSLSSVADVWYGGTSGEGTMEIPEGNSYLSLVATFGDDIYFPDNGIFTFTLASDFSTLNVNGSYDVEAQYFLIGEFNDWKKDEKVTFEAQDGVSTLTQKMVGEFLVLDNFGNLLGGSTDDDHYLLHEDAPSVTLTTENKKNFYLVDESEYTLTIQNGVLTVSGWPEETISAWLLGATDEYWQDSELNFELRLDPNTGNYILGETDIPAGYRFQVVKRSSLSSVDDVWYGSSADNDMFSVTEQTQSDIPLTLNDNKSLYFKVGGTFTFTISPDFSTMNIDGEFNPEWKPTYYLIGDFNGWNEDEEAMVPFAKRDGVYTLELSFCGDFLIKDCDGNRMGTCVDDERYVFTASTNNAVLSNADGQKNFRLEVPSDYTLTIQDGTLTVTGFPTEGYYMCGDFNDWMPEPMTKNADGSYSIVMRLSEHDQFKFCDYIANWYGGDTEESGDTYEIDRERCSDVPLVQGDLGFNFIINTDGTYKFILAPDDDAMKLTVVGLGYITLADALEGVSGTIEDELYVAAVHQDQVYVTNGTDWVRFSGVFNANDLLEGYCIDLTQTDTEGFDGQGTGPIITINGWLTYYSDDPQVPVIAQYSLAEPFDPMPKPCQVVQLTGMFLDDDGTRVLCAYDEQTGDFGPAIQLADDDGMEEGFIYRIKAAIILKEPWPDVAVGASHPLELLDTNAIDNLVAMVLDAEALPIATDVISPTDAAHVVSVKYVNTVGQVSLKPFTGINIVVTTYSDGTTTTVKEVR